MSRKTGIPNLHAAISRHRNYKLTSAIFYETATRYRFGVSAAAVQRLGRQPTVPYHDFTTCSIEPIAAAGEVNVFAIGCDIAAGDDVVVADKFEC